MLTAFEELRDRVADAMEHGDPGVSISFELAQKLSDATQALAAIERARPHHYQMFFEDHARFAQRLKAMARAVITPST